MSGKIIVFEGTDGSGKATQKNRLCDFFRENGIDFREVTFPRYSEESSSLVRMYLGGEFGSKPTDVPAKTSSVFFAVDRYASYQKDWKEYYQNGGIIVCDRYTTSNAVHQTPKLPENEWWDFTDWLFDFEYNLMGIPKPDLVFFMDMPSEYTFKLIEQRQGNEGDIHEKDHDYLVHCRECALKIAERYDWKVVHCIKDNKIRTIEDISNEVCKIVTGEIK